MRALYSLRVKKERKESLEKKAKDATGKGFFMYIPGTLGEGSKSRVYVERACFRTGRGGLYIIVLELSVISSAPWKSLGLLRST